MLEQHLAAHMPATATGAAIRIVEPTTSAAQKEKTLHAPTQVQPQAVEDQPS